jgi:osmotically-inducible protein OsmY
MAMPPTEFTEIIKFRFGAPVVASDGASGVVEHVIVDPGTRTVTHVGIKLTRYFGSAHSIPVELVKDARVEQVELSIPREEIAHKAQAMPDGFARLSEATTVDGGGKRLGRLVQISVIHATLAMRRLVVARGLSREEVLVPVDATTHVDGKHIAVQLDEAQMKQLIAYRPDADLLREVADALYNYPRLRVDLPGIEARAVDGEIWLRGHVSSDLNSRLAVDQLVGIKGIVQVHNELVTDTDLAAAVAAALARDPRTQRQHIGVYPTLGDVRLGGVVRTPEARAAATQVAEAVPGVARVENELAVRADADVVPIFSGITGKDDQVPGGA